MNGNERDRARARWFPPERAGHWIEWGLLVAVVATFLTNAHYLRFLEPSISRKAAALGVVAVSGLWMAIRRWGVPRTPRAWLDALKPYTTLLLLAAILAVAFGLRIWGISGGLPQSYVPDEYDYVHSYLQMIKRGDLNPHWWYHPSLQPYVNVVTFLLVFFLQVPSGRWASVHQLQVEDMLWWGRLGAGVIPGTLAVLVAFWLGRRLFGEGVGLLAAALLAVFPGAVEVSQYNKPDALLVLTSAVSVLVTLQYLAEGGKRRALFAGLAIGITVGAKYNGALVLVPFVLAVVLRHRSRSLVQPDLYVAAAGTILGFVAVCPYFLAELPRFIDQVADGIYTYGYAGREGAEGVNNWYLHASYTVRYGAGWASLVAGLVGLGLALYRLDARLAVFVTFPILYYSFYGAQRINFPGNLIPVYPFLAVLAGYAVFEAASSMARWIHRQTSRLAAARVKALGVAGLMALLIWFPVNMTMLFNRLATLPDTGSLAREWIQAHFPPGTHFAVERHTPVLDSSRYQITMESRIINRAVRDYRSEGVQYLIVSSTVYQRFNPEHRQSKNYQKLFEICRLVVEFEPVQGRLRGPTIRILEVPDAPPQVS